MEAALSEVPEDQLVPYTEGADYAAWSARCEAAEKRWKAMRDDADTWDPHLDRPGIGKAALEADLDRLGELRGHDEAWAALYAMRSGIAERARAEHKATFDLPEWNELADKAGGLCCKLGEGAMRDQGASCSPYVSALARRSCSNAIASVRAHGPRSKARSTIRASPTMPPWRANIPAWPLRSARITSKPLIVA